MWMLKEGQAAPAPMRKRSAAGAVVALLLAIGSAHGQDAFVGPAENGPAGPAIGFIPPATTTLADVTKDPPGVPVDLRPIDAQRGFVQRLHDLTQPPSYSETWNWQMLPDGIIYQSYLAGVKEPRFASQWVYDKNEGGIWDVALGGRVGIIRYGTQDGRRPEGWQLDMEGAAFPRLNMEESLDVMATDFRFGVPLTYGTERYQTKFGFYHLCSHLGDELMLKHPEVERINYSRNCLVWGHSYYWTDDIRLYAEASWAFYVDGGARPWEFQFGVDYSPARPTGTRPVPFFAINSHLREDIDYGGNFVVETGYQWRGASNHLFRAGMQYYTGKSDQYEFFRRNEDKIGLGLWYDY
jgi:hypothetical protein